VFSIGVTIEPSVPFYLKAPWKPKCAYHEIGERVSTIYRGTEFLVLEGPISLNSKSYYRIKSGKEEGFVLREHIKILGPKITDECDAETYVKTSDDRMMRTDKVVAAGTPLHISFFDEAFELEDGECINLTLVRYRRTKFEITAYIKSASIVGREPQARFTLGLDRRTILACQ
jgi:hypothetical protein